MTAPDPRIRLVILFGGRSAEHDISCISASHVLAAVNPHRYEVVPVGITREGGFVLTEAARELAAVGSEVDPLALLAAGGNDPSLPSTTGAPNAATQPDPLPGAGPTTVVLPILHGPNGEDGTVQGLLEIAGIPYVGAGVLASSLAMDKAMAKVVLRANGIAQVPWRVLHRHEKFDVGAAEGVFAELGDTVFVKPANMGSSIGVSKVSTTDGPASLVEATEEAFRYDDVVVFEQQAVGRELEIAVLGNDEPAASVVGEVLAGADFYDYGDKYFDGNARTVIPADLPVEVAERARRLAVDTFEALRCHGMARVDLFCTDREELLVNEVNTIPGFTPISMYPKLWEATGLPYDQLIDELVRLAIERHARRSSRDVSPS